MNVIATTEEEEDPVKMIREAEPNFKQKVDEVFMKFL